MPAMMEFSPELKKYMEEKLRIVKSEKDPRKLRGVVHIKARLLEGLRKEAKSGKFIWYSDQWKGVGGKAEYPGPLQYFLSGMPLCQMVHYTERSALSGLRIESIEIDLRGNYDIRTGGSFEEIIYETRITSPESEEKIAELVKDAEGDCYVTNTLAKAITIRREAYLNGKLILKA
jgi:uncharacterized OsmC-like protein